MGGIQVWRVLFVSWPNHDNMGVPLMEIEMLNIGDLIQNAPFF